MHFLSFRYAYFFVPVFVADEGLDVQVDRDVFGRQDRNKQRAAQRVQQGVPAGRQGVFFYTLV